MARLKVVIYRESKLVYRVEVQQDYGPGYVPKVVDLAVTWTLPGARKKGEKLLRRAHKQQEYDAFKEEL